MTNRLNDTTRFTIVLEYSYRAIISVSIQNQQYYGNVQHQLSLGLFTNIAAHQLILLFTLMLTPHELAPPNAYPQLYTGSLETVIFVDVVFPVAEAPILGNTRIHIQNSFKTGTPQHDYLSCDDPYNNFERG